MTHVHIDGEDIPIPSEVKSLGVHLDRTLSMDKAVSHIRKVCYLELRKISQIRLFIDEDTAKKLVLSFVAIVY